jgi:hypothetical protein
MEEGMGLSPRSKRRITLRRVLRPFPDRWRWSRRRSRRQRNTWRLTVSPRTQSPSKCLTVYGGGEPLRAAGDQWCSEARSVHRVA